jgi:hypothetical protein
MLITSNISFWSPDTAKLDCLNGSLHILWYYIMPFNHTYGCLLQPESLMIQVLSW